MGIPLCVASKALLAHRLSWHWEVLPPLPQVSQGCGLQLLSVKVKFSLCKYGFVMMKSIQVKLSVGLVLTWVAKYTEFKCH